jgi:hypothetical protein
MVMDDDVPGPVEIPGPGGDDVELWYCDPDYNRRRKYARVAVVRADVVDGEIVERVMTARELGDYARTAGRRVFVLAME